MIVLALIPFLSDIFQDPIFSLFSVLGAFAIGLLQGIILGRAIMVRFPRLQNNVKKVSISLFVLFLANAIF
jgi:ABC-type nitrate/sulfonate/bicarbonate transport system permease component